MEINQNTLMTWNDWQYTSDLMEEIQRRVQASSVIVQKDSNGNFMADNKVPEPEIMMMAVCEMLEINDPFSDSTINKSDLGLIVVLVDVLVIIFVLAFTWTLEIGQENFVRIFDKGTIEMQDFSLKIKKMPDEKIYTPEG